MKPIHFLLLGVVMLFLCNGAYARSPSGVYAGNLPGIGTDEFDFRSDGTILRQLWYTDSTGQRALGHSQLLFWHSSWFSSKVYVSFQKDSEVYLAFEFDGDDLISKRWDQGFDGVRYRKQ